MIRRALVSVSDKRGVVELALERAERERRWEYRVLRRVDDRHAGALGLLDVVRGSDSDADVVVEFVMNLYDAVDGRTAPVVAIAEAGPAQAKAKRRGKPVPLLPPPKEA